MRQSRALLCDLDGVLRLWAPESMPPALRAVAFEPALLLRAVTGLLTDEDWRAEVAAGLGADGERLVADWTAWPARVDAQVLAILAEARQRIPVVLVTNATTRLEDDLATLGLADATDAVVNSARVGVAKPDERIYRIAADRAGVPVEDCLFVDDTAANVRAAEALGMRGLVYTDPASLAAALGPVWDLS